MVGRLRLLPITAACVALTLAPPAFAYKGGKYRGDTSAPSIAISAPAAGATVSGAMTVSGTASDTSSVAKVEVRVDGGSYVLAAGTTGWSRAVDTKAYADGAHTVTARATDAAGNVATTTRSLTFDNTPEPGPVADTTAPAVAFATPASGATVSGTVAVSGSASDAALAKVEVRVDGGAYATASGTSSWSWSWNTTALANGTHTLTVRATDAAGNATTATRSVTVSNTSATPTVKEEWISPEGVRIQIFSDVTGWTAYQVYELLRPNAYELARIGPNLTIKVQTQYASQTSSSASTSNGIYTSFRSTMYLKAAAGTGFTVRPDHVVAHEYGHVWTMYHLYLSQQRNWIPWTDARGLTGDTRLDSSYNWNKGEMIADDYRLLFGTETAKAQAGYINPQATDPRQVPGLKDFLVNTWARP